VIKPDKISLIVTTYNWPEALRLGLLALENQDENFEVLIADDGSCSETAEMISSMRAKLSYPIRHIHQEDDGFRAAKIRNKAAAQAEGDYLIFMDGDCIPSSHFLARHRGLAERNWWVTGNRILLSEPFTKKIIEDALPIQKKNFFYWCKQRFSRNCNRLLPLLHFRFQEIRKWFLRSWKGAKTCNLAVWKKDFIAVNGFDEAYEGWGYEDSDLVVRLIRANVYRKDGRFAIPVFHLWHTENDRSSEGENAERLEKILSNERVKAQLGVQQYME